MALNRCCAVLLPDVLCHFAQEVEYVSDVELSDDDIEEMGRTGGRSEERDEEPSSAESGALLNGSRRSLGMPFDHFGLKGGTCCALDVLSGLLIRHDWW